MRLISVLRRWSYLQACLSPLFVLLSSNALKLGDRYNYLSGTLQFKDANILDRTQFVSYLFGSGGIFLEVLLSVFGSLLFLNVVDKFLVLFNLRTSQKSFIYLIYILPVHFLLRNVAGKELVLSFILSLLLLLNFRSIFRICANLDLLSKSLFPHYISSITKSLHASLSFLLIALAAIMRPYVILLFLCFFIFIPFPRIRYFSKIFWLALIALAVPTFLVIIYDIAPFIQSYMYSYFVIDGSNSNFSDLQFVKVSSYDFLGLYLFKSFYRSFLPPFYLLNLSNITFSTFLILLEGFVCMASFIVLIINIFKISIRSPLNLKSFSFIGANILIYSLIFFSLGYVNALGGWRYQSGLWPLYVFLLIYSFHASNIKATSS